MYHNKPSYTHAHTHTHTESSKVNETLFIFNMDNPALLALLRKIEKKNGGDG